MTERVGRHTPGRFTEQLDHRGVVGDMPAVVDDSARSHQSFSGSGLTQMLKSRAVAVGLPADRISGHSLRAGHATPAAIAAVDLARMSPDPPHPPLHPRRALHPAAAGAAGHLQPRPRPVHRDCTDAAGGWTDGSGLGDLCTECGAARSRLGRPAQRLYARPRHGPLVRVRLVPSTRRNSYPQPLIAEPTDRLQVGVHPAVSPPDPRASVKAVLAVF